MSCILVMRLVVLISVLGVCCLVMMMCIDFGCVMSVVSILLSGRYLYLSMVFSLLRIIIW